MDDSDLLHIIEAFEKEIGAEIKGVNLPKNSKLFKASATTAKGPRRILYLIDVPSGNGSFLMYRSKNDPIGKNMSINNPLFKKLLGEYVHIYIRDMSAGNYKVYATKMP